MIPMLTVIIVSILCVIFWYIKIDSETVGIYGIYVVIWNIICLIGMIIVWQSFVQYFQIQLNFVLF